MIEHRGFVAKGNAINHSETGISFDFVTTSKSSFHLIALKPK
jgi:hypothetical protein